MQDIIPKAIAVGGTIGIGVLFLLVGLFALLRHYLLRKGRFSHALGLGLLQVQLPTAVMGETNKNDISNLREKIAMMEQIFAQLGSIKESGLKNWIYGKLYFVVELAVPKVGQEVLFYVGVPRKYLASVEKMIHGVYADAQVERVKDYTIFHPSGAVSTATARASNRALPFRTYQNIESDPLGGILNAFSKVSHEGEGLALQIVCTKAKPDWNEKLK